MNIYFSHLDKKVKAALIYNFSDIGDAILIKFSFNKIFKTDFVFFKTKRDGWQTNEVTETAFPQAVSDIKSQLNCLTW